MTKISFRAAHLAQNAGFPFTYAGEIPTNFPSVHELHDWIVENLGYYVVVIPTVTCDWTYKTIRVLCSRDHDSMSGLVEVSDLPPYIGVCGEDFSTHTEALLAGVEKVLDEYITHKQPNN